MTAKLNYFSSLSFVVGNMIGVGIFTTTGTLAEYIQNPFLILAAWIAGGIYALSGAKVYGVLSSAYPLSGGDFQYLSKELHPLVGYVFGWSIFFITYPGSIAAMAIGAAWYLNGLTGISGFDSSLVSLNLSLFTINISIMTFCAVFLVIVFTAINIRGLIPSARYQAVLTAGIIVFILLFIVTALISDSTQAERLVQSAPPEFNFSGFALGMVPVMFTYMGWTSIVYMAEEVDNASLKIKRILIHGVITVIIAYLLLNLIYLMTLPVPEIGGAIQVAEKVSLKLWGPVGSKAVSFLIFVAILSTINSSIVSGSRITMVMGREGYFLRKTGRIHKKYNTPHVSLMLQAAWTILLLISGNFNQLLNYVIFAVILFSVLAGALSIKITLRTKRMDYSAMFAAALYIILCLYIAINLILRSAAEALTGIGILLLSVLFYFIEKKIINSKVNQ